MLHLEEEAARSYGEIFQKYSDDEIGKNTKDQLLILIKDETRHAKLVRELLKIVKRQED